MTAPLTRRSFSLSAMALATGVPLTQARAAEAWPSKPIKLVLPNSPGAGSDQLGRAIFDKLAPVLKQPVIFEYKPGASGAIAALAVIQAPNDGHTLLYSNAGATIMAEALIPKLPFSTLRDLVPITMTAIGGVVLVVNQKVPARNLRELIDLLKREPDRYGYGSNGIGSNGHLTMEWLKQRTGGFKSDHIPYNSNGPLLLDVVSGVIPIAWLDYTTPVPYIQQGRIRAIAVNGPSRNRGLPDVAHMTEQGFPFPGIGFQGIFAPAGTPREIVQRLNLEINKALALPEMQNLLARLSVDTPPVQGMDEFRDLIARNLEVWRKIANDAHIQLEA